MFKRRWAYRAAPLRPSYEDLILGTPGLLAYYRYEELSGGQFPLDSSPSGYDATVVTGGGPALIDGRVGSGLDISGSQVRAEFPSPATDEPRFQGPSLSVETWFRWSGSGGAAISFRQDSSGDAGVGDWPFRLTIDPFGTTFDISVDLDVAAGSTVEVFEGGVSATDTTWHHLAYTYEEGVGSVLYIDGVVEDTGSAALALACSPDPGAELVWEIGDVYLDETAIYDTILSPSQVAQRYNLGRIY